MQTPAPSLEDWPATSPSLPAADVSLEWRPLALDDAATLHSLLRAGEIADRSHFVTSLDEVRREFADPDVNPATDTLGGLLPDGRLACFTAVQMRGLAVERRAVNMFGSVHPDFRRQGLGTRILRWSEERARERLDEHRDGLQCFLEVWSDERWTDRRALFTSSGYARIRHYEEMRRPLSVPIPAARLEAGLRFERWSRDLDEAVRLAHNEAFADHRGSQPLSPETWAHRFVGSPHFRPDLSCCALDGADVAGYCLSYHSAHDAQATGRLDGWLGQIGVRRQWRKRGVATALISHIMGSMARAGLEYAALHVDSANPSGAAGLYRRLGFATVHRETRWAKEV